MKLYKYGFEKVCNKKVCYEKDARKKDAVGILNLVIVQIFETNFLNICLKKLCNFRVSSADLVFEFYRDLLLLGCVRKILREMSVKIANSKNKFVFPVRHQSGLALMTTDEPPWFFFQNGLIKI